MSTQQTTLNGRGQTQQRDEITISEAEAVLEDSSHCVLFDLTTFPDSASWRSVLQQFGIEWVGFSEYLSGFLWSDGKYLTISTQANPNTGVLSTRDGFVDREVGYASHIMITAENETLARNVADAIVTHAEWVKKGRYEIQSDGECCEVEIEQSDYDVELPEGVTVDNDIPSPDYVLF